MSKFKHPFTNSTLKVLPNSHGYTGFVNLGNTCFLNSCIQIINHIYELTPVYNAVFDKYKKPNTPDTNFFEEWIDLYILIWNKDGLVSPARFVEVVQKLANIKNREMFAGFAQNDIHEFIHLFIDTLHTSISRKIDITINGTAQNETDMLAVKCYGYLQAVYKNEYSEILDLFYGIYVSKLVGMDEKHTLHSSIPENFFILDLPIPCGGEEEIGKDGNAGNDGKDGKDGKDGNMFLSSLPLPPQMFSTQYLESQMKYTLYDCFDLFTKNETLEGDNSWFNEATGRKERVYKKIEFWNFPKILVISIKRFSACGQRKRNNLVDFPIKSLDLSKYVCGYNPQKYKYDLFGVCNHYGGCNGGHYTAFVLNYLDEWVHYNDEVVERGVTNVITPAAYCLFYRIVS
jgi:ubiquitin C-terminal hydrolase